VKKAHDYVLAARAKDRPTGTDYINGIFSDFIELHGDRRFADDPSVVGGLAMLDGTPFTVIATEKGKDTKDRIRRNFGAPNPEGYRKALRLMKQAEKFRRPVACFVDTSGAFCGIGAEERGQGQAIAENLMEMMTLKPPSYPFSLERGAAEEPLPWLWPTRCGCWRTPSIRSFPPRGAPIFCGRTRKELPKPPKVSG